MSQNDFFISHSTKDHELVDQLITFLQLALKIDRDTIYCTSAEGTKNIGYGENFIENIKEHVTDTKMVICIFTPNYFKSEFCLAELGAAWILNTNVFPIIIPPTHYSILGKTPLGAAMQSLTIKTADDIVRIADHFRKKGFGEYREIGYVVKCATTLMQWIDSHCKFEEEETVSQTEYLTVQSEVEKLQKTIHQKDIELAYLKAYYEKTLKSVREENGKVSEDGRLILVKKPVKEKEARLVVAKEPVQTLAKEEEETTDKWALFYEQVNSVKSILSRLDDIVLAAIYYEEVRRGSMRFWPSQKDFFNWNRAYELKAKNEIYIDEDDQQITPNYDQFLVGKAATKLRELSRYMSSNIDEDMEQEFAEDYEFNLEFTSIKFWEKILNVTIYV
ncbi:toll/interleukin-1 receptor domain-containing protein [Bacillus toyonensis]|uniref:toll/interleukin-1 receptor domain-containing protein n=1 Tax=Bacillus toyonensis TaxID=155322 RepID=UPI001443DF82|nr:toll/interleukin-1 receptor domain-containing protein [Bacillus toyonensis]NKW95873.1 toll/interleukin-1 receptor domain-containing protein [Bacillus toyonensis]